MVLFAECFWLVGIELEEGPVVGEREGAVARAVLDDSRRNRLCRQHGHLVRRLWQTYYFQSMRLRGKHHGDTAAQGNLRSSGQLNRLTAAFDKSHAGAHPEPGL